MEDCEISPKEFFYQAYENNTKFSQELRKDFRDLQIRNLEQRRGLWSYIPGFSAAIISLSVQAINYAERSYIITGLLLHLVVIFFVLSYLREKLDQDANGLEVLRHKYCQIIDQQDVLLLQSINKGEYTTNAINEYVTKLKNSPDLNKLDQEYEEAQMNWQIKSKQLDYSSETAIALFVIATFFILASILKWHFLPLNLSFILMFIIILCFNSTATIFTSLINKIINLVRSLK